MIARVLLVLLLLLINLRLVANNAAPLLSNSSINLTTDMSK